MPVTQRPHARRRAGLAGAAFGLALVASVAPASAKPKERRPLATLDASVARAMQVFEVPGLAVAVVKDGAVVHAKGYGVRRLGEPAAVDADTLFGIASNTKAFTCAAISILAEQGLVSWDDPVVRHLPGFQMYDPWVTREVRLRDLVTHRAGLGLGQGDLMWWPATDFSRREIVRGIRELKPASSARTRYAYNNVMYVAAGEVVAEVARSSWDAFVRERIFVPLGMSRSNTSVKDNDANAAAPHVVVGGRPRPVPPMQADNCGAAGAINSSASEMARWLRMLLECGRDEPAKDAACVLKPGSIRSLWAAQIALATPDPPKGLEPLRANFAAYGLGFGLRDYRGRKIVSHTGGLPGYVSQVTLVPEERLGAVVLTNQEEGGAFRAVTQAILDDYLGAPEPPVDWTAAFHKQAQDEVERARLVVQKAAAARRTDSSPSLPLAGYAGRYRDPWYGEAVVSQANGRLTFTMARTRGMVADLEHWQHDTFVARWREAFMSESQPADAYLTFALKPDASVERLTLQPVSPAIDFSFDFQDLLFTPVQPERAPH
jgi:CubicO group peptidase (beta-lactamase class C family)